MHIHNQLLFPLIIIFVLFAGCTDSNPSSKNTTEVKQHQAPNDFVKAIESAENFKAFNSYDGLAFDLKLIWGGKEVLNANVVSKTNSSKVKMIDGENSTAIYDGEKFWLSPATAQWEGARFDLFTWQYFFMAPFKLSDPGTRWEMLGQKELNGKQYDTAKLSFSEGTGDADQDWYIVFKDPETNLVEAMAYIVTFSSSQEEAEKSPGIILYDNYETVNGVKFPTSWTFKKWNETEGVYGDPRGTAQITNVKLIKDTKSDFLIPADTRQLKL